ncbi:MAG: hypothetical protein ABJA50_10275, partial [Chloroflexota bacterium]
MLDVLRWVLGLPLLLFMLYAPGAVVLNSLDRRSSGRHLFSGADEWIFTAVLVSFLTTGLLGFVLAEVGLFSWWLIVILLLGFCLVTALSLGMQPLRIGPLLSLLKIARPYPRRQRESKTIRLQSILLGAIILLACALFSRPDEMLRGALDSGAYVNGGVAIANSGSILQHDPLMRELDNDKGEVKELTLGLNPDRFTLDTLRMPAFYVLDKKAALILPQHYSLYPVWIGLLDSLFGIWGALYATPLLALLAVLAVYYFARRSIGVGPALLALLLLVLCPVTIWFARYPVAEVITGLLAFSAFFSFARMVNLAATDYKVPDNEDHGTSPSDLPGNGERRTWSMFWGLLAAASLGEIALARPDFIFYIAPVPLYLLYWRLTRRWKPGYTWFASTLAVFLLLYSLHFVFFTFAYTLDQYYGIIQGLRRQWAPLMILLYVGLIALIALDRLYPRLKPAWSRLSDLAVRYRWVWAGAIVLAIGAYVLYRYAYDPWKPNLRFDKSGNPIAQAIPTTWESYIGAPVDEGQKYNLLRVGWYLSPFGLLLGAAGLMRWVWGKLNAATGLFFMCLLIVGVVFIQETFTEAHYIYTMRRYVPVVLPALIIGFAWFCAFFWARIEHAQLAKIVWALAGLGAAGLAFYVFVYIGGVILPVVFLVVALSCVFLSLRVKPEIQVSALASILAVALAVFFVYTGRVIIPHVEEQGAVSQLSALASRFDSKSVLLFSNERDEPYLIATPMQYIYGVESFALTRSYPSLNNAVVEGAVDRWQKQGYKVYVLMGANGGKLHLDKYSFKWDGYWEYRVPEFEQLYTQKPSNVSEAFLPWGIYSLEPKIAALAWPFKLDIGDTDYQWLVSGWNKQER